MARDPKFVALASGPHRLARSHRGLVRQWSRRRAHREARQRRLRSLFGVNRYYKAPLVTRVVDWWQTRSKNKYDKPQEPTDV